MCKIKSLKKLRNKSHDSEVFHCGLIGIDAYRIDPDIGARRGITQRLMSTLYQPKPLIVDEDGDFVARIAPSVRER